jgi:hypothetical protein
MRRGAASGALAKRKNDGRRSGVTETPLCASERTTTPALGHHATASVCLSGFLLTR